MTLLLTVFILFILKSSDSSPSTASRFKSRLSGLVPLVSISLPSQSLIQHSFWIFNELFGGLFLQLHSSTLKLEDQVNNYKHGDRALLGGFSNKLLGIMKILYLIDVFFTTNYVTELSCRDRNLCHRKLDCFLVLSEAQFRYLNFFFFSI